MYDSALIVMKNSFPEAVYNSNVECVEKHLQKLKKSKKNSHSNQQQLLHEAMIVGSLEHPNIIPIHQILVEKKVTYLWEVVIC